MNFFGTLADGLVKRLEELEKTAELYKGSSFSLVALLLMSNMSCTFKYLIVSKRFEVVCSEAV